MTISPLTPAQIPLDAAPPDITLFIATLTGGGAERVILCLCNEFIAKGLRVDIVVAKLVGELTGQVNPGARLIVLGASRVVFCLPAYLDYLHRARPAVVVSSVENSNLVAAAGRLLSRHRHRLIIRIESALFMPSSSWQRPDHWPWLLANCLLLRWADRFITVSEGLSKELRRIPGLAQKSVTTIYNPVIEADFLSKAQQPLPPIAGLFENDIPIIVSAGRLHPQKDFSTLIRAFQHLRKQRPCKLLILGEGAHREVLTALARKLDVANDVVMPGFVANPIPIFRRAAAFVLASEYEGLGNVLVEALAAGVPVISTDCPFGPREVLDHGRFGKLVPVGDDKALAQAILETLSRPSPLVTAALEHHLQRFQSGAVTDRHLEILALDPHPVAKPEGGLAVTLELPR
jgi:glycosyltransferase involved in cell wall biosynthesis